MAEPTPKTIVSLTWNDGLAFTASHGEHAWVLDGRNEAGPSPVIALASALAGCMAIDIVHILSRGRHKVGALTAEFAGERALDDPKRFIRIDLQFRVTTTASQDVVERAVELSHEKYCSVWHSMRQDISFHTSVELIGVPS